MEIGYVTETISSGIVVGVSRGAGHKFSKPVRKSIKLLAGLGVEGDAHLGTTVKHRSRVARDPNQPDLRQAHLIHDELFDELRTKGFRVGPGLLGENITTRGIGLLTLPRGARLRIGSTAIVLVTRPPPSSHCEKCGGELRFKEIEVADGGLDLGHEIFVCANCGHEKSLTVSHDRKTPHTKVA